MSPNRWKNSIKNSETDTTFTDSDHYPVIATINVKLKAKPKVETLTRIKYHDITPMQRYDFNTELQNMEDTSRPIWESAAEIAQKHFSPIKPKEKEDPISEDLQTMFNELDKAIIDLDIETAVVINKHIDKLKKQERKNKVHKTINKDLDLRCNFLGIRNLKKKYQPIPYMFKTKKGNKVNYNNRAEAAACHLSEALKKPEKKENKDEWICPCADVHMKIEETHCLGMPPTKNQENNKTRSTLQNG